MDHLTVAPVAARISRPTKQPDPLAPSRTSRSPRGGHGRGEPESVAEVVVETRPSVDRPTDLGVAQARELLGSPDQLLELVLDRVVELEAMAVEHLEPVVVGRVVRGRDHDPGGELAGAGEVRQGGRRDDADDMDVRSEARRAGGDRRDEHVARPARVLADDDRASAAGQSMGDGPAEGIGRRRLEVDVGDTADPVGAEQARHWRVSPPPRMAMVPPRVAS